MGNVVFSANVVRNIREDNLLFPPEIIDAILQHLSPRDKLISREVCRDWNTYLSSAGLENLYVVKLIHSEEDVQSLAESSTDTIPWTNFYIRSINLTRSSTSFWINYRDLITSLHFDDCCIIPRNSELESDNVEEFRLGCPHLKHLALTNCNKYMMMGSSFFNLPKLLTLENLESLDVSNNSYLNDSILFGLLLEIKSLQSLTLTNCPISFMNPIFRRFYPGVQEAQNDLAKFSDSVLTFQMLALSFLSTPRASSLVELNLSETRVNPSALQRISESDHCNLMSVILNRCTEVKGASIPTFCEKQPNIKKLELERVEGTTSERLAAITAHLSNNLTRLVLKNCDGITDLNFLMNVQHLRHLDLSNCRIDYTAGTLCHLSKLSVLKLSGIRFLPVFEQQGPMLAAIREDIIKLKELTELDLGNCGVLVSNALVQGIIQNLKQVRILNLFKSLITDDALVGGRGRVGVADADSLGFCLERLEHLKELNLANCLDLEERTWTWALRLPNLVTLDLARCSQITIPGIRSIIKNCSNLENLVLLECGVRDAALVAEIRCMPRMKNLVY